MSAAAKKRKAPARGKAAARRRPSIAEHPRAIVRVRQMKGWGALAGFSIGANIGLRAGAPLFDTGVRALVMGGGGYVLAWAAAVQVWRQIVVAEIRAVERRLEERDARKREVREAREREASEREAVKSSAVSG